MIQVFEQMKLDGISGSVSRFDPIDDHTAGSRKKTSVEIADRVPKLAVQLPLPMVPVLSFHVTTRDALPLILEHLEIGRELLHFFKECFIRLKARCSFFPVPIEHAVGVTPVILRVSTRRNINDDTASAIRHETLMRKVDTQLRFTDSRCSDHDGQCSRQQAPTQCLIQSGNPRRNSRLNNLFGFAHTRLSHALKRLLAARSTSSSLVYQPTVNRTVP